MNIQNNVGLYNEEYTGNLLGPVYVGKCYLGQKGVPAGQTNFSYIFEWFT